MISEFISIANIIFQRTQAENTIRSLLQIDSVSTNDQISHPVDPVVQPSSNVDQLKNLCKDQDVKPPSFSLSRQTVSDWNVQILR